MQTYLAVARVLDAAHQELDLLVCLVVCLAHGGGGVCEDVRGCGVEMQDRTVMNDDVKERRLSAGEGETEFIARDQGGVKQSLRCGLLSVMNTPAPYWRHPLNNKSMNATCRDTGGAFGRPLKPVSRIANTSTTSTRITIEIIDSASRDWFKPCPANPNIRCTNDEQ